jgi:hypothetical protein
VAIKIKLIIQNVNPEIMSGRKIYNDILENSNFAEPVLKMQYFAQFVMYATAWPCTHTSIWQNYGPGKVVQKKYWLPKV